MAQHDYVIANGTGAAVRSDLNGSLAAIVSNNSGATEPGTMYAYQWWADTTTGLLKIRNAANNAWVTVGTLASTNLGLLPLAGGTMTGALAVTAGTAALPGIAVSGDLNTGITSPGADQLAISTGGTSRLAVSTTAVSSTLAVDVTLGAVATPSLTFTGDLNTGIYSPGADQVAITTAGVQRVNFNAATEVVFNDGGADVDFRIEGDTNANLFKIDAGLDEVQVANLNGGPIAGTRNRIINGDMRIDQRNAGASLAVTSAGQYTLDRWAVASPTSFGGQLTAQRSTTVPAGFTNSLSLTVSTADASIGAAEYYSSIHRLEGFNVADFGWGAAGASTVKLSFWVRASIAGTYSGSLRNNAQDRSYVFEYSIAAANTWEYKTIQITGDTTGTWLKDNGVGIDLWWSVGTGSSFRSSTVGVWQSGTFLASNNQTQLIATSGATFYITGVQLEPGTVATPFERRSFGQELALCQRYYEILGNYLIYSGNASNGSTYYNFCRFAVAKRAVPTVTTTDVANSSFPAGNPAVTVVATDGFYAQKTASATSAVGYFQYSATATAEF